MKPKIKALHLLDSVNRGGAETQVLDICRNASRYDFELTLVTAGGGVMENDFRESGVEFIRLDRKLPVDVYFVSQLRKIIKERDIEVVHGYQAVDGLHLYLATQGLKNVKRVLSFQGFIPGRKNRTVAKLVAPRMHANISVSKSLMTYLRDEVGIKLFDNFHVVYNGADEKRLQPTGGSIKNELHLPAQALLAGMVANFTADPTKDQLTICRALPRVIEQFPNFHFVFAGRVAAGAEDKMAECLEVCIANDITTNVHFLGARPDVPDILDELDLFVFSSRQEGFPVAVSEAMLIGVPLVLSDIEPLREAIVSEGDLGEMFPVGDHAALSEKMIELLGDEKKRAGFAENARQYARQNFSIDSHLRGLSVLYTALLNGK
jgi:glycosyltransferase involved in cell wall biosynthesis